MNRKVELITNSTNRSLINKSTAVPDKHSFLAINASHTK